MGLWDELFATLGMGSVARFLPFGAMPASRSWILKRIRASTRTRGLCGWFADLGGGCCGLFRAFWGGFGLWGAVGFDLVLRLFRAGRGGAGAG